MIVHPDVDAFDRARPDAVTWERCAQALRLVPSAPEDVTRSIGDSLTYLRSGRPVPDAEVFTGHRRYHDVVLALSEPVRLEIAPVSDLTPYRAYSDLTDRETFTGRGETVDLLPGEVLVLSIAEALRFPRRCPQVGIVRMTVEATAFHNK